jgi:hypothetical protein
MPQDLGHPTPETAIPGPSRAPGHAIAGTPGRLGQPAGEEPAASHSERSERCDRPPPLPGLVHTETKFPFDPDAWAAWELQRRLSRMRRRTITRSRIQCEEVQAEGLPHLVHLVTFTYAPGHEWRPGHVRECLLAYRKQADRDGIPWRYEWVAELQLKRMRRRSESSAQCMHYHAIIWQPEGYEFPHPDTRGWWPHGMTNVEVARNPVGYLAKYASKGTEGERLPRGARISGGGGLSRDGRMMASWWLKPRYVREAFPDFRDLVQRARGGGWINRCTGEVVEASEEWRCSNVADRLRKLSDHC